MTGLALLIGIGVGLILGLTGAGGSIVAVPLLTLVLNLNMADATGLSLIVVAASAAFGVATRIRHGEILWLPGLVLAVTGMLVAPLGRLLATGVPDRGLMLAFSALALAIGIRLWRQAQNRPAETQVRRAAATPPDETAGALCRLNEWQPYRLRWRCLTGMSLGGLSVGLLSGLFGVGGGFLIVPLLMFLTAMSLRAAVATSLLVITLVAGVGFASHLTLGGPTSPVLAAWLAGGGLLGMLAGNRVSRYLPGTILQRVFAVTVILMAVAVPLKTLLLNG